METLGKIYQWLWDLLPDKCEREDCNRWGMRGNENVIDGEIVCDYCHARDMRIQQAIERNREKTKNLVAEAEALNEDTTEENT